jgi:hypothetical protein
MIAFAAREKRPRAGGSCLGGAAAKRALARGAIGSGADALRGVTGILTSVRSILTSGAWVTGGRFAPALMGSGASARLETSSTAAAPHVIAQNVRNGMVVYERGSCQDKTCLARVVDP